MAMSVSEPDAKGVAKPALKGSNPIVKMVAGAAIGGPPNYRVRRIKKFKAICPDCGQVVKGGEAYGGTTQTRKQAKDALHRHRQRRGTYWGCSAQSTPALEGE